MIAVSAKQASHQKAMENLIEDLTQADSTFGSAIINNYLVSDTLNYFGF